MSKSRLQFRRGVREQYGDVLTPAVCDALEVLSTLNLERQNLMRERLARRAQRATEQRSIGFLDPAARIRGTDLTVADARAGKFVGSLIPDDLRRQWIQGTGPAARPGGALESNLRNVAYALLSGADGWMFDGEDACGQLSVMSLDNQRSLSVAFARLEPFERVAASVAVAMNEWAQGFFGHSIVPDWKRQLEFTTRIFRARGLHLADRHIRDRDGSDFAASIVDVCCYIVNNQDRLRAANRSLVLYLPKIQTAEEAAFWHKILSTLEGHLGLPNACIITYVLVEQLEASFQLLEIRAVLGARFIGFNTGRWDYINSVADALAWDREFCNPNIDAVAMTYSYMAAYEDRVRRAVNVPDLRGGFALWQGGMEPNIPVGSALGMRASMQRAVQGAQREQLAGASGKWVAHWKMVHIVRPVWETAGKENQLGRMFERLTHTEQDAASLTLLTPAPRTVRGARDLLSVAMQYGNAFLRGYQAAALKPADSFGDDDVLYLMEDMATGEIRLSILWEWLHKGARFTHDDPEVGVQVGDTLSRELFLRLLSEEHLKLMAAANRDVHDDSKHTTLPIAREIVERYVQCPVKLPWYIDLLNLTLDDIDLARAKDVIESFINGFTSDAVRSTEIPNFDR